MSHTPGPWKRAMIGNIMSESYGRPCIISESTGNPIAICTFQGDPWGNRSEEEEESNLRAVEALPNLLAACKEAKRYLEDNPAGHWCEEILSTLESVIAKAEGESP